MRKAPKYGADALILDSEDSVPPENKQEARTLVRKIVKELGEAGQLYLPRMSATPSFWTWALSDYVANSGHTGWL